MLNPFAHEVIVLAIKHHFNEINEAFLSQLLAGMFKKPEEIAFRRQNEPVLFRQGVFVGVHRLQESIEGSGIRALIVGRGIDRSRLSVSFPFDLLRGSVGF